MHSLLATLERDFDIVLCDAPPLLPVTDAAVLAKATSGAIVVVAAGRTARRLLHGAIDSLQTVDAKVAGIVLSMMPTRGPDAYHTYGHGYRYAKQPGAPRRGRRIPRRRRDTTPLDASSEAGSGYFPTEGATNQESRRGRRQIIARGQAGERSLGVSEDSDAAAQQRGNSTRSGML